MLFETFFNFLRQKFMCSPLDKPLVSGWRNAIGRGIASKTGNDDIGVTISYRWLHEEPWILPFLSWISHQTKCINCVKVKESGIILDFEKKNYANTSFDGIKTSCLAWTMLREKFYCKTCLKREELAKHI